MYKISWLLQVARQGFSDMLPAVRRAFNDDPTDDRLELVYGARPRRNIVALALAGILAGIVFDRVSRASGISTDINWSAVFAGAVFAGLIRRYLFVGKRAAMDDFPWLAGSLAPATGLLMIVTAVKRLANEHSTSALGTVLLALTDALGVAAVFVIAVAALCFSRNWARAIWDLAIRVLVFRIMVWVTALILLEIGIVGPIVSGVLSSIFGFQLPEWLPELFDQLSYAAFISIVYLAVIGATWTVCRRSFGALLETGEVNVLETVAAMAKDPESVRKKQERARKKQQKKARRGSQ